MPLNYDSTKSFINMILHELVKFVGYTDRLVEAMSVKTFQPIILVCKVVTSL